ncbi:DUF6225 family protein [Nonomuraea typhae]|uniref:DUF6225 family protein n=1 Tax=Nonomuraea typhae TaxID=2603600 RepID=A0ABW7Z8D5_9ACTN
MGDGHRSQGRSGAWTAGQLREALADLSDDTPVVVHVAGESDPESVDDQIITSAGYGNVGWGDGYGMERDPIFALECHWHTKDRLLIRPKRPRRT